MKPEKKMYVRPFITGRKATAREIQGLATRCEERLVCTRKLYHLGEEVASLR